jgi:hypothetical protein
MQQEIDLSKYKTLGLSLLQLMAVVGIAALMLTAAYQLL